MKNYLTRKVGFEGTLQLGPCWKSQPVTYEVKKEWKYNWICKQRQFSLVGQNFSWLEHVGHGLEQQGGRRQRAGNLWDAVRRICVENECTCFCDPIKSQSKTTKTYFNLLIYKNYPICERSWTDIEPETYSPIAYPVSKQLSTLLRHGHLPREEDGAIEFGRLKDYLRNEFEHSQHGSDEMWESKMARGGGNKKRFQHRTDPSGQEILHLRALQQCRNSGRFLQVHFLIGCAANLHSVTNSGLTPGGQNLSKRQTVFFTSVDPVNKEHIDPNKIELEAPRLHGTNRKSGRTVRTLWIGST